MISPRLQKYFDEYSASHRHPVNLIIHKIAIPFIVFHITAMLSWVRLFHIGKYPFSLAEIAAFCVVCFYFTLNKKYALIMAFVFVACIFIAHVTPVWLVLAITVTAWTIQLLGHAVWEKKAPAFTDNFIQVLIGPLFMLRLMFG